MDSNDDNTSKQFAALANLLQQVVEILDTSSIVEERGKDATSKFWAAYKKISGEYDNNMLERCNGNMDIIMLFAGLFSAVNTAFIIAMQPNPADTTNQLLVTTNQLLGQLMHNTWNGSSVIQPVALSESVSVTYSSSKIWMQVLAYTSLTFSLLAAFGAVLGKQWLGHYKTNRFGRGRLEDQCQQRHHKFEELDKWWFEHVLDSFSLLLQISLVLFIFSLAAAMWMQHQIISFFIIVPTACGTLSYVCFVWVSLRSPDSPFQTSVSSAIRYLLHIDHKNHNDSTASAMAWILDTSTNVKVLNLVLDLMVTRSQNMTQPSLSSSSVKKVLDIFNISFDSANSDDSIPFGRALIYIAWKVPQATEILDVLTSRWKYWASWRSLYFPWALKQCKTSFQRMREAISADAQDQAENMRTALRMALGAGMDKFVNPDEKYVELVWDGQFGSEPNLSNVDWLMNCAEHFRAAGDSRAAGDPGAAGDFGAAGDALLLFSNLKKPSDISQASIVPFLNSSHKSDMLRHSALRAACRAVDINSCRNPSFSKAVLTAVSPLTQCGRNGDFSTNAIHLLGVSDWDQYGYNDLQLKGSSFISIQHLIFLVLPAPSLKDIKLFRPYCHALIRFMRGDIGDIHDFKRAADFRHVALRNAYHIRQDLATSTGTPSPSVVVPLQKEAFSKLPQALLTIVRSNSGPDYNFYALGLIFTLARHVNWLSCLDQGFHIKGCIEIIPGFCDKPPPSFFYLTGIFLRARGQSAVKAITTRQWWDMTRMAWHVAGRDNDGSDFDVLDDGIDILEALVTATKMPPNASMSDREFLCNGLGGAISKLESRQSPPSEIIISMNNLMSHIRLSML